MRRTRRAALAAVSVLAFLAPSAASAVDVTGKIVGRVDGETREWFITRSDEGSRSTWSGMPALQSVALFGHAEPDTVKAPREALAIDFDLMGEAAEPSGVEIRYLVSSFTTAYVASETRGARVEVTEVETEGDMLRIRGTFRAELNYSDSFGRTIDRDRTREIAGRFEAEIAKR